MTRSLLLKGLAGVAALGGTVGGLAVYRKEIFGGGKGPEEPESEDVSKLTDKELIDKAGLSCQLTDGETEVNGTKECSVKNNESIKVKIGNQEEEGVTFTTNGSKLKVSKSDEGEKYTKNLKFVVDSGDLTLTKTGGSPSIPKLEQFETYEVFLRDKKFYLRRKTDSKEEKIKALGLPSGKGKCSLPETGSSECSLSKEDIKTVSFEKKSGEEISLSSGSVTLKISKMTDSDSDFGESKYRFTFTFPSEVTINSKNLKAKIPYDFKIKKGESGNTLTLERAWSDDNAFTKKAGLECTGDNKECSIPSSSKLNVKVGDQKKTDISTIDTTSGKIKMETEQAGYNQGLKFTITTADISLTSGTGDGISKLEELETYEITEEGGKYYLTRKTTKEESIRSSLSIPENCFTATGGSCTLTAEQLKNINFDGKSNASASGNITLKISKVTNTTDFPLGYRFTFSSDKEATITASTNVIKANIPTDFKIKKNDSNPASISLEKAWSETKFAEKVGLTCTSEPDGCCTKSGTPDINVKRGNETKTGITSFGTSDSGKIKVEKDQAGYNQGLKFTISGGSVTLTGGNGGTFTQLDEYETYEITEEGDKYYLTRKTEASETIETQLGLKEAGCSLSDSSSTCSLTTDKLKKINFSDKEENNVSISSGTATLTITKAINTTDFPLGYKFTLQSTSGDITIKTGNVVKQNIPTEFKIKKPTNGGSLTLEKAWTADSLGKKVGLSCTGETECTIETSGGKLRVKQQDKNDNEAKSGNLSKATSGNGCSITGKIKVTKEQEGYNQGFKFKIEEGNIVLTGSTGSSDSEKVHRLGEFETYEIKEEGTEWYLVRKERADKFIKDQLKLKDVGCSEYEKFPHSSGDAATTCRDINLEKLKKINFEGKNGHDSSWPTASVDLELEIKHDSSLPGGFKFTFSNNGSSDVCLPTGKDGGKFNFQKGDNSKVEYKIKKTGTGEDLKLTLEKKDANSNSGSCS